MKDIERQNEADAGQSALSAELGACKWAEDEEGVWNTDCAGRFIINEGTPMLNDMKFCCYCGKPLDQVDFVYDDDVA